MHKIARQLQSFRLVVAATVAVLDSRISRLFQLFGGPFVDQPQSAQGDQILPKVQA